MASEYGLELLDKVQRDFAKYYANDSKIKKLTKKIANNSQNYEDANEYAIRVGELASKALTNHVNSNDLNYISRELAEDVLKPTLTTDYELISNAIRVIQGNMNNASNISLQPQIADLDTNRIDGLINKIASYETLDQGEYLLKEPVVNYSQAVVDDSIRKNAKVQAKAGLTPKIRRVAESGACRWCRALEGVYEPQNAPDNIYRRHEFCRCQVTYENGKSRQDVWSKTKWEVEEEQAQVEKLEKAIEENKPKEIPNNSIAQTLGEPFYNQMQETLANSNSELMQRLFDKMQDDIKIGNTAERGYTAYYSPISKDINFNLEECLNPTRLDENPLQVFFHEGGHNIDYKLNERINGLPNTPFSYSYNKGEFYKTIEQEVQELVDAKAPIIKEMVKNKDYDALVNIGAITPSDAMFFKGDITLPFGAKSELKYRKAQAYRALEYEIRQLNDKQRGRISDILEGATKGKVKGGYGHGNSYWNNGKDTLATEAFAEMIDSTVCNPESLETIKYYLPKSYEVFEKMINEVLK